MPTWRTVRLLRPASDVVASGKRSEVLPTCSSVRSWTRGHFTRVALSEMSENPDAGLATVSIEPSTWLHMARLAQRSAALLPRSRNWNSSGNRREEHGVVGGRGSGLRVSGELGSQLVSLHHLQGLGGHRMHRQGRGHARHASRPCACVCVQACVPHLNNSGLLLGVIKFHGDCLYLRACGQGEVG
jgi:hypothetical protein